MSFSIQVKAKGEKYCRGTYAACHMDEIQMPVVIQFWDKKHSRRFDSHKKKSDGEKQCAD